MIVKAAPGLRVPKEDMPREYITEDEAVEVPATIYYRRCLAQGDLIEEEPPVAADAAAPAPKAKSKE